ncbi:RidA family protein [Phytoactinopolyspora halotolerans]|uniref:RidA family protein n=1 Tax=Phytoactinopolyspora halotolerans TaxID=1981512 RepID=A0A6L9SA34_9ACTN|nr:RidA family protein [Phytoactinopolyspora halotolerans]
MATVAPVAPTPLGADAVIDAVVVDGGTAYVSGQVAFAGAQGPLLGKVGVDVDTEKAAAEAGTAVANGLYRLIETFGSLDAVQRALKLTVFVNSTPEYTDHPAVANGASRVLLDVLGERGRHARSAVGVASLPLGVPVEVELVVKVAP